MRDIIIGDLVILGEDLGEMTWRDANNMINKLGPGWRLPTYSEWKEIFWVNVEKISGINMDESYWVVQYPGDQNSWSVNFSFMGIQQSNRYDQYYVRPVREITSNTALEYLLKEF